MLHWKKVNISCTCYQPGKTEDVQDGHAGQAQDVNGSVLVAAGAVGENQRQEAGRSQHNQVHRDSGLQGAAIHMCGTCTTNTTLDLQLFRA